jgi:hypothetical protein
MSVTSAASVASVLSDRLLLQLSAQLKPLLRAYDYAADLKSDLWQFSLRSNELSGAELTHPDLIWLHAKGWIEVGKEISVPSDETRAFRKLDRPQITSDMYVILTPSGADALRNVFRGPAAHGEPQFLEATGREYAALISEEPLEPKPYWNAERRELMYRGTLVKRFRVPAANQERILAAFEEEGWPGQIDDPLPPDHRSSGPARLYATLKSLNRRQLNPLLWFHGNGNGRVVLWEYYSPRSKTSPRHSGTRTAR